MTMDDNQFVMWRAVLEAIGYDYMGLADSYRAAGVPLKRITVTEGGSRDGLWNQIKSNMLGAEVCVLRILAEPFLPTAYSALMLQVTLKASTTSRLRSGASLSAAAFISLKRPSLAATANSLKTVKARSRRSEGSLQPPRENARHSLKIRVLGQYKSRSAFGILLPTAGRLFDGFTSAQTVLQLLPTVNPQC